MNSSTFPGVSSTSCTLPASPSNEVERTSVLETLSAILDGDSDCAILTGEEGKGKTVALAQFARRNVDRTIAVFTQRSRRYAIHSDIARLDFWSQLLVADGKDPEQHSDTPSDGDLATAVFRASRIALRRKRPFVVVADGLLDLGPDQRAVQDSILSFFPLGSPGFKFLFSAQNSRNAERFFPGLVTTSHILHSFDPNEARAMLAESSASDSEIEEARKLFDGNPGRLAALARVIKTGTSISEVLAEPDAAAPDLFDREWQPMLDASDSTTYAVATVAFAPQTLSLAEIAEVINEPQEALVENLRHLSFLSLDVRSQVLDFHSDSYRRLAQARLSHLRGTATTRLADHLLARPDSEVAIASLPELLRETNRLEELIDFLSPKHFASLLNSSQSLATIRGQATTGAESATRLSRLPDAVRLGLQAASMRHLESAQADRLEVEAYLALGETESAISLAASVRSKELKLHLLAIIARRQKRDGLLPEPVLDEQIQFLYRQVDARKLGDSARSIARDLMATHPKLALDLLEKSDRMPNLSDAFSYARALSSREGLQQLGEDLSPSEKTQLRSADDPTARKIATGVSLVSGDLSAEDVLAECENLDDSGEQLHLLRLWLTEAAQDPDALNVSERALHLLISAAELPATAAILLDIALPLPHSTDEAAALRLIGLLDAQIENLRERDVTADQIRLKIKLSTAALTRSASDAVDRAETCYLEITDVGDPKVRLELLSTLAAELTDAPEWIPHEDGSGILGLTYSDIEACSAVLLSETAYHLDVFSSTLTILSHQLTDTALGIAERINTQYRRDEAHLIILDALLAEAPPNWKLDAAIKCLDRIVSPRTRNHAHSLIWSAIADDPHAALTHLSGVSPLVERISEVEVAGYRSQIHIAHYLLTACQGAASESLLDNARDELTRSGAEWQQAELALEFARVVADHSPESAEHLVSLAQELRATHKFSSRHASEAIARLAALAARAYRGLLPQSLATTEDKERLLGLVSLAPSIFDRAAILGDLALALFENEQITEATSLVNEEIADLQREAESLDLATTKDVLYCCSPALDRHSSKLTTERILSVDGDFRDEIILAVVRSLLTKVGATEPVAIDLRVPPRASHEDLVEICDLLTHTTTDCHLFSAITWLKDCMRSSEGKRKYTSLQREDIADRIDRLVEGKLPSTNGVHHEGYIVAASAASLDLRGGNRDKWEALGRRAASISNISDSAYVLACVAVNAHRSQFQLAERLADEAIGRAEEIPCALERATRRIDIARTIQARLPRKSKRILRNSAMNLPASSSGSVVRRVLDSAYSLDPDFARELAELLDDDPARANARVAAASKMHELRLRADLAETGSPSRVESDKAIAEAAWSNLGRLNVGAIPTKHVTHFGRVVGAASTMQLPEANAVFAWFVENAVRQLGNTYAAASQLRPLFESAVLGVEMMSSVLEWSTGDSPSERPSRAALEDDLNVSSLVRVGERTEAMRLIERWIRQQNPSRILICDPYFSAEDLDVVAAIDELGTEAPMTILTSKEKNRLPKGTSEDLESFYRMQWREIRTTPPPDVDIVVAGTGSRGALPIHDRWLLVPGAGIQLGTSFNSLGISRTAEILQLTDEVAAAALAEVEGIVNRTKRVHDGERISVSMFVLT